MSAVEQGLYAPLPKNVRFFSSKQSPREADHFVQGIPDVLRSAFFYCGYHAAVVVLDLINHGRITGEIKSEEWISIPLLNQIAHQRGWTTTRNTLETGVHQLIKLGILRQRFDSDDLLSRRHIINPPRRSVGRPSKPFQLRRIKVWIFFVLRAVRRRLFEKSHQDICAKPLAELFGADQNALWKTKVMAKVDQALGPQKRERLKEAQHKAWQQYEHQIRPIEKNFSLEKLLTSPSTPLESGQNCRNANDYVKHYRQAIVKAQPGRQIARKEAAAEVGRSVATLRTIDKRIGIERIPEFDNIPIDPGQDLLTQIQQKAPSVIQIPPYPRGINPRYVKVKTYFGANLVALDREAEEGPKTYCFAATTLEDLRRLLRNAATWAAARASQGYSIVLRVQRASREYFRPEKAEKLSAPHRSHRSASVTENETEDLQPADQEIAEAPQTAVAASPVTTIRKVKSVHVKWNWTDYNPAFVAQQLAMRGLANHPDGLIVISTGEILTPHTHPL